MGFVETAAGKTMFLSTNRAHHVMETGDDLRAKQYSPRRPFKTIQACLDNVYEDGDIIVVWPGEYDEEDVTITASATITDVHIYYMENAIINLSTDDTKYITPSGSVNYHIHGRGQFNHSGSFAGASDVAIFEAASGTSTFFIHGAKSIICDDGYPFSNRWGNIENVDLIWAKDDASIGINTTTVVNPFKSRNGRDTGIIRNIKECIAGSKAITVNTASTESIRIENCNFTGGPNAIYAGQSNTTDARVKWINCTFRNDNERAFYCQGYMRFFDCKFQNDSATLPAVWVDDPVNPQTNPRPLFYNCDIKNVGGSIGILNQGAARFSGLCRIYGEQQPYHAVRGFVETENVIDGTVEVNNTTQSAQLQVWIFNLLTTPPTVGEIYTITAPDTSSISYTVLGGDTRTDVNDGLVAAWLAEQIAEPTGDFAKFTPVAINGPTLWRIFATAVNADDNLNPANTFVPTTSGTDSFTLNATPLTEGWAWKGSGKFIVNDDLFIENIED